MVLSITPLKPTVTEGYVHPTCLGALANDFAWGSVCPQCGDRVIEAIETRRITASATLAAMYDREDAYDVRMNARASGAL